MQKTEKLSFIALMKDKTQVKSRETVLHSVDEGQNPANISETVLHSVDEGQNPCKKQRNCPS